MLHLILAAGLAYGAQAPEPANDFAFRLENKSCRYERIDSFKATFSMFRLEPIPMILSDQQRSAVFEAVTSWKFFDLPTALTPVSSTDTIDVWELEVRNDGRVHRVTGKTTLEQARPLGQLATVIAGIVRFTSPAIARLLRGDGCFDPPQPTTPR